MTLFLKLKISSTASLTLPSLSLLLQPSSFIFTYFKIPLTLEDYITQPVPIISANSFKTLRFYKTAARGWKHASELTPEAATALTIHLPDHPSLTTFVDSLQSLREDHVELRARVDLIHSEMGFFSRKLDDLIRMTSLVHPSVKLAVNFKPSDSDHVTNVAYHIIQSTSYDPHFI